jgi:hypothetical protein
MCRHHLHIGGSGVAHCTAAHTGMHSCSVSILAVCARGRDSNTEGIAKTRCDLQTRTHHRLPQSVHGIDTQIEISTA